MFAEPRTIDSTEGIYFYHCLDLPNETIESAVGGWDMRGKFRDYVGGIDVAGKRVLDVGTASGFLAFEAERHGASEVVAFDALRGDQREMVPTAEYRKNKAHYDNFLSTSMESMKNGFWYCHNRLKSRVRAFYGDVYDIPDDIGEFDVVIVGQILVHLKHPLTALEQAAMRVKPGGFLVITEGTVESTDTVLKFIWLRSSRNNMFSWWLASNGLWDKFMDVLDFKLVSRATAEFGLVQADKTRKDYGLVSQVYQRMPDSV